MEISFFIIITVHGFFFFFSTLNQFVKFFEPVQPSDKLHSDPAENR